MMIKDISQLDTNNQGQERESALQQTTTQQGAADVYSYKNCGPEPSQPVKGTIMSINSNTDDQSIPYILDAPCSFLLDPSGLFNSRFIRNPHYLQPFTRVGRPVFATGAVLKNYTEWGDYFYADCYLVPDESAHDPSWIVHPIALHPCAFQTGEKFILLQIQERVSDTSATWEQSLAEALSAPIGQWLKIRANREQQRVEFELMSPQMAKTPEYPEFLTEVLSLAVSVQIPDLERQIRSLIREMPQGPVPHCTDRERPMLER
jgi:hypothetical protein